MTWLEQDELIPATDVARLFHRTLRTLSNWEKAGILVPERIRGQRYYRLSVVEALLSNPKRSGLKETE